MTRDRETARRIAQEVQPLGGSVYYVGGCVRDRLLGRESKDLDIEVHGVTPQQMEAVLDQMGGRRTVGVSFGVYGLAGCGLDIAMAPAGGCRGSGAPGLHRGGGPVAGARESRPPPGFHRQRPDGGRAQPVRCWTSSAAGRTSAGASYRHVD